MLQVFIIIEAIVLLIWKVFWIRLFHQCYRIWMQQLRQESCLCQLWREFFHEARINLRDVKYSWYYTSELSASILFWYWQWRCSALTQQQLHVPIAVCQFPAETQTLCFSKEGEWGSGTVVSLSLLAWALLCCPSIHAFAWVLPGQHLNCRAAYWWSAGLLVACTYIPDFKYIHTNCGQCKVFSLAGLSCSLAVPGIYAKLSCERFFPATACGSLGKLQPALLLAAAKWSLDL